MKYNLKHIIAIFPLLSMIVAAGAGCSSDEIVPEEPDERPILFASSSELGFSSQTFSRDGVSSTEDPQSVGGILPETVGLFGEMEEYLSDIFYNQIVYRKDGKTFAIPAVSDPVYAELNGITWPADNNWIYAPLRYWSGSKDFQFYCYAPHSSVEGTTVNLTNNSYGQMTMFEISNIRPYSSYDYMVADCYKFQKSGTVPFNMCHLSARICIRLKIGEKYSKMRKIKITEVSVNDRSVGGTYFLCSVPLSGEPMDPSDNGIQITSNGAYTPATDPAEILLIPIFNEPTGLELKSDKYQQFGSLYVMPQTISTLTINVKYDVYDHTEKNVPIRKDQRVTNTISFKDPNTGDFRRVESGKYYEVNILVSPEYLYVLSDNDVKPDFLISPE